MPVAGYSDVSFPNMMRFHSATFGLLGIKPKVSSEAVSEVEGEENRMGFRLPASVREWYCNKGGINLLAKYSNQDWPIPLRKFAVKEWKGHRLLPFKYENQGVCTWAIVLDGSDDPPVYVDVDSNGAQWNMLAPTFSAYVYVCVWDYVSVLDQPGLVQAQNGPLSSEALDELERHFSAQPRTFGWLGSVQYRFAGKGQALLIWSAADQADWFVGASDAKSLESALRTVWGLDGVGQSFYDCSEIAGAVLDKIKGGE